MRPRLERRELTAVIGQAGAALVVEDQPKRTGKPLIEVSPVRVLPPVDEVRCVIRDKDKIRRAAADNLVRNRDSTILDVPDISGHTRSVQHPRNRRNGIRKRCFTSAGSGWRAAASPTKIVVACARELASSPASSGQSPPPSHSGHLTQALGLERQMRPTTRTTLAGSMRHRRR